MVYIHSDIVIISYLTQEYFDFWTMVHTYIQFLIQDIFLYLFDFYYILVS